MKSLELFTGAGGLALGVHAAGFEHVGLVEWNKPACDTLRDNTQWAVHECDVRALDFTRFGDVDLIAGGAPCQPFSLGGKHKGKDDERNMFPEFVRAVRELQPQAFVVENVKGLLRAGFREYFDYIVAMLRAPSVTRRKSEEWTAHARRLKKAKAEYTVDYSLLNAADYGVPQTRERVFIVGFRADLDKQWVRPAPTHAMHGHGGLKKWKTLREALKGLPEPTLKEHKTILNHRLNPGARSYPGHTGSPLDWPAKTLKAGVHGVPGGENMIVYPNGSVRYLTVREAARVQTFPDTWKFAGPWSEAMRQLGNAVPMELAAVVARNIRDILEERAIVSAYAV